MLGSPCLAQTEGDITIKGPFNDISFKMFAEQLRGRYNIKIYYLDEWVENVVVDLNADSIILSQALHSILHP